MSLLNDELNVLVLEGGTLMGLILITRRTTENASRCISDVDRSGVTCQTTRTYGLTHWHSCGGDGRYDIITSRISDAL